MRFEFFCAEKKCNVYMRDNLRAPPWKLVLQWGRQLAMDPTEIKSVSDKLSLRHALGKKPPPPPSQTTYLLYFFQALIQDNFPTVECGKKLHQLHFDPRFLPKEI
jgi:hypothetical protein